VTLQVIGKIAMQDPVCEKCSTKIPIWKRDNIIKCRECGAFYTIIDSELQDQHIDYSFNFVGFKCINITNFQGCDNICPAPGMYCREHVSDSNFITAKNSITYAIERLADAKENLKRMEESKKTWLIQEVSGIDEQNNSIREDSDGED
jgi:hypothetical protein